MISLLFLASQLLYSQSVLSQNIAINEVMSSNGATIADEDGDYEDWIEIYNFDEVPINLEGYGLSDNYSNPYKWIFPNVTINPGQHIIVWTSGKNRRPTQGEYAPGILREVYAGIPGTAVSDLTNHISYPANPTTSNIITNLFEAPTNVGDYYGQRIHGFIKAPTTGQYRFWIAGDDYCQLFLSTSSDPNDAVMIAQVPGWTNPREWSKYSQQQSALITLQEGEYYYIKALMKENDGGDNLAVGWQIPGGTLERPISGQHLFRSKAELHTNFSISQGGEEILLTNPSGEIISELEPIAIPTDISYGRVPDGSGEWFFFDEPTPGADNITESFTEVLSPPSVSLPGGFYSEEFNVTLTHSDEDVQIVYTIDGSVPSLSNIEGITYQYKNQYPQNSGDPYGSFLTNSYQSVVYSEPIRIYDRSAEADKLTKISTTWDKSPNYFPSNPVKKGIVVKAKAIKTGAIASKTVTNSYFVNSQGTNPYTLPLISLSLQEDALFDYNNGIYVAGKLFDDWRAINSGSNADGGTPSNYWLRGDFTESTAHFEYFEQNSTTAAVSQEIGVRLHGGWSRAHPLKSLRLYARARYGESHFNYAFFPDNELDKFRRLILRNSGNDYWNTHFRDAAIQRIVSHLNFETQSYRPSVVFINGEYWGIHNIRERFDKHYLEGAYGVDPENIDLLEVNANADEGDADHYNSMISFIQSNTLASNANYEYVITQMDVSSFIDYQIANIFAANTDWPGNNIKYWRLRTNQYMPNAPKGHDGRWRWMLYDTDFGFGLSNAANHNTLQFATDPNGPSWPNPSWSTLLLRKLLENESFKYNFINRFADLLNTTYLPTRMVDIINQMKQVLNPEIQEHINRWRSPGWGSISNWNNEVNAMIIFANQRPANQRSHIRSFFSIANNISVTVNVNDTQAGYIRINTIEIIPETPGVSQSPYPWQGVYFRSIPIQIEAKAKKGFVFSHWEGVTNGNGKILNLSPTGNVSVTAHFKEDQVREPQLLHYWHFNSLPSGTLTSVSADFSEISGANITYPGSGDGYMDSRTHRDEDPVSNLNLQLDQLPNQGAVLRVRNPSNTRSLQIASPTNGFGDIILRYATARTSNGATQQEVYYSADGGNEWVNALQSFSPPELPSWSLVTVDLSAINSVNDNSDLIFKIVFTGSNSDGSSGNNRFDNISVSGTPVSGAVALVDKAGSLNLWPNPANDYFILNGDGIDFLGGIVRIYTVDGALVKVVERIQSNTRVSIGDLSHGVYIVKLITAKSTFSKRLVKR